MSNVTRFSTFSLPQKFVAKFVLPLVILTVAAGAGMLIGGSTAPNPASAATTSSDVGACIVVCGVTSGGGGNIGTPVPGSLGTGGSGMGGSGTVPATR